MKISELLESRPRNSEILYHGTTDTFLESILKFGLIPNPPQKGYGSDVPEHISFPDAVYITPDLHKARSAAETVTEMYGGQPIIVEVSHTLSSGKLDEDAIFQDLLEYIVSQYESTRGNLNDSTIYSTIKYVIEHIKDYGKLTKKSIALLFVIHDQVKAKIDNFFNKNLYGYTIQDLSRGRYTGFLLVVELQRDPLIRKLLNELIDTIKVFNFKYSNSMASRIPSGVRIKQPITFRGTNRIVSIYYAKDRHKRNILDNR